MPETPSQNPRDLVEDLRQSEERFRLLVEGVQDYAIFMLDTDGHVMSWNAGAERIKGYRADEIIGSHFSRFYSAREVEQRWPWHELEIAKAEGRFENEGWRLRKDGSRFWANVVITALRGGDGDLRGFAKVTRDMTERKRSEDLEDTTRRMTEFLAVLAHELRNPLASIRNAIAVMQEKPLEDPDLRSSREVLSRQASHLGRLVDDLLDMGRITSGKIALKMEPLVLGELVERSVEVSMPFVRERRHALETCLAAEPLYVQADPVRLTQILTNLIHNAAKYTEEGGRIRVDVERDRNEGLVRVQDTGVGIRPDLLSKIFDLFVQGDANVARPESGLGIGLTIVRRLAEMHGGTVEAFSPGIQQGSEFVLRLPLLPSRPEAEAATPAAQAANHRGTGARRVLVVDDNDDSASSMAMLLGLWGHEVQVAHEGEEALRLAESFQPEVVLLDIGLPGMSGYEVAARMRAMPPLEEAKLVTLTGYGDEASRKRAKEAGFDSHAVKPVDPKVLRTLVETGRDHFS